MKISHELEEGSIVYLYEPKISYKVRFLLSLVLKGYEKEFISIHKDNTKIEDHYFITKERPEDIVKEINSGLKMLLDKNDLMIGKPLGFCQLILKLSIQLDRIKDITNAEKCNGIISKVEEIEHILKSFNCDTYTFEVNEDKNK